MLKVEESTKIIFQYLIGFLVFLCLYILLNYFGGKYNWDSFWVSLLSGIMISLVTGLFVGVYYELFVRKQQTNEVFNIVGMDSQLGDFGIKQIKDFRKLEFGEMIKMSSKQVYFFTYGRTFVNNHLPAFEEAFKKPFDISFYILDESNPFIDGYGELWSKYSEHYTVEGIKSYINETKTNLLTLIERLNDKGTIKANIKIRALKYHPYNCSFYIYDNTIIFCPSKFIEDKNYVPLAFIGDNNKNMFNLNNWCKNQLDQIIEKEDDSITNIYPNS